MLVVGNQRWPKEVNRLSLMDLDAVRTSQQQATYDREQIADLERENMTKDQELAKLNEELRKAKLASETKESVSKKLQAEHDSLKSCVTKYEADSAAAEPVLAARHQQRQSEKRAGTAAIVPQSRGGLPSSAPASTAMARKHAHLPEPPYPSYAHPRYDTQDEWME